MKYEEFKNFIDKENRKGWAPCGLRLVYGGHNHGGQFHNNFIYIDLETADGWRVVRTLAISAHTYGEAVAQYFDGVIHLLETAPAVCGDFATLWAKMCAHLLGGDR